MKDTVTPFDDPKFAVPRKQPSSVNELIHKSHTRHMVRIGQEKWLTSLLKKADRMKVQQERKMNRDLETLFPTGTRKKK